MFRLHLLLTLIFIGSNVFRFDSDLEIGASPAACDELEQHDLMALYNATNGSSWTNNTNWGFDRCDVCDWFGISCENGKVVSINLRNNNLDGTLPEFTNIDSLIFLDLSDNSISGYLPSSLFNQEYIISINLNYNNFSGTIPTNITGWNKVEHVGFFDNNLSGSIPSSIWKANLKAVNLSKNNFNGEVTTSLSNSTKLQVLSLHSNDLSGPILNLLDHMMDLKQLYLNGNNFNGSFNSGIRNWTKLTHITIQDNNFSGSLPKEIGQWENISTIDFDDNNFDGVLPDEFYSLSTLKFLDLGNNKFQGPLQESFSNLSQLYNITLSDNNFSGELPAGIGYINPLQYLRIERNDLSGEIPSTFENLNQIRTLWVSSNNLEGTWPEFIGYYPYLSSLGMSNNLFRSCFPDSYINLCGIANNNTFNNNCTFENPDFGAFCAGASCDDLLGLYASSEIGNCSGESIEIFAPQGYVQYQWSDSDQIGDNITVLPAEDTWYSVTVTDLKGCTKSESILIDIEEHSYFEVFDSFCEGSNYELNGSIYTTSGQFEQVLTAANGCDSVITINLNTLPTYQKDIVESICSEETIEINNISYSQPGTYEQILTSSNGCDSILTINILNDGYVEEDLIFDICHGQSVEVNGVDYVGGIYEQTLVASNGCDSILNIIVNEDPPNENYHYTYLCDDETIMFYSTPVTSDVTFTIPSTDYYGCVSYVYYIFEYAESSESYFEFKMCEGESVDLNGVSYVTGGLYEQIIPNSAGCDSIIYIDITEYSVTNETLEFTLCDDESVQINGENYGNSGIYTQILSNTSGCDSIVDIHIEKSSSSNEILELGICENETIEVNGITYSSPGSYLQEFQNSAGCDSTLNIVITENGISYGNIELDLCPGSYEIVNQIVYDQAGYFEQDLIGLNGCDSVLQIFVDAHEVSYGLVEFSICSGESIKENDFTYTQGGIYEQLLTNFNGCDSILTIEIEERFPSFSNVQLEHCKGDSSFMNNEWLINEGMYEQVLTNTEGCDSLIAIELFELEPSEAMIDLYLCPGEQKEVNSEIYNSTGLFIQNLINAEGCDSILSIHIHEGIPKDTSLYMDVCFDETVEIENQVFSGNGSYVINTHTENGCDSIINLYLNVVSGADTTIFAEVCPGEKFYLGDKFYSTEGFYQDSITIGKCRVFASLYVEELHNSESWLSKTICEDESYYFHGQNLNEGGNYFATITNSNGCDSTIYLTLNKAFHETIEIDTTLCTNEPLYFDLFWYNSPGNYIIRRNTTEGCDKEIHLNFKWEDPDEIYIYKEICEGEVFTFQDTTYETSGQFHGFYNESQYCLQPYELELVVRDEITVDTSVIVCEGESIDLLGNTYNAQGSYEMNYSMTDCKTIGTLHLLQIREEDSSTEFFLCQGEKLQLGNQIIQEPGSYSVDNVACSDEAFVHVYYLENITQTIEVLLEEGEQYYFNGIKYSEEGEYHVSMSKGDCIGEFILIIEKENCLANKTMEYILCDGDSYEFYGTIITEAGIYEYEYSSGNGCDTNVVLNVQWSEAIDFEIEGDQIFCYNSGTEIFGPEGFQYEWSTGETSRSIVVNEPGLYSLRISKDGHCAAERSIELYEIGFEESFVISTLDPGECEASDGQIIIDYPEDGNYMYTIDGGASWSGSNTFNNLPKGLYYVGIASEDLGCSKILNSPVQLVSNDLPNVEHILSIPPNSCLDNSGVILIVPGEQKKQLEYSLNEGLTWTTDTLFEDLEIGVYSVWFRQEGSTCINTTLESIHLQDEAKLDAQIHVLEPVSCLGLNDGILGVNILDGLPPFEYVWSDGSSDAVLENVEAGTYGVSISDAAGCTMELLIELEDPDEITDLKHLRDTVLCNGESVKFSFEQSELNYYLFMDDLFIAESNDFIISEPGSYRLIAENIQGCYSEAFFSVSSPNLEELGIDFLVNERGVVDLPVAFVNISDPMPAQYEWHIEPKDFIIEEEKGNRLFVRFMEPGLYHVQLISEIEQCAIVLEKEIEIFQDSSFVNENISQEENLSGLEIFKVYPSPNNGMFSIELGFSQSSACNLTIFNSYGNMVESRSLKSNNKYLENFNLSQANSGVYTVFLSYGEYVAMKNILIFQ